ncbi:hypothetical protein L2Z53_12155 (plasmid) [Macrococcoides canis]|uniref:hypothetical protein n=1 Tax=Macrococcoides canis TaxID=1855823 RepID=UPI001F267FD2|nr:hypothetical protein [Macrococcus canis]UJS29007.1 hypothetical protein L2Z53_12155 [Macrococcus canis]
MKRSYAHVSSSSENLDKKINNLKDFGCKKIFIGNMNGMNSKVRPVLQEPLNYSREQERTENKRRQLQSVAIDKKKGIYKL